MADWIPCQLPAPPNGSPIDGRLICLTQQHVLNVKLKGLLGVWHEPMGSESCKRQD